MSLDYAELCRRTRERDRSLREKVMSLDEAAALVPDGASVGIGGSTLSRTPLAIIWALIRAGRKDLFCARGITSSEGELLFASGKRPITSEPIIERIGRNGTPIAPARNRSPTAMWLHSSNRARPVSV